LSCAFSIALLLDQEHQNLEALMDENHKEGTTRRDLMKLGAAVAGVVGSLSLGVSKAYLITT
jgi:hypothetical protein